MSLFRPILALSVLALLLMSRSADAYIVIPHEPVDSVELLAIRSDTIVHARLISRGQSSGIYRSSSDEPFTFEVIQAFKGRSSSTLHITRSPLAWPVTDIQPGQYAILARQPRVAGQADHWTILKIDASSKDIWTLDLKPLTDTASIITAFRTAVAYPSRGGLVVHTVRIEHMPSKLPGRPSHLSFPADARLESAARRWATSADPQTRIQAVAALAPFRSEQNIRLLQSLLHDPATTPATDENEFPFLSYDVRAEAYKLLNRWQVPRPTEPVLESPSRRARFLNFFRWPLIAMIAVLVFAPLLYLVARQVRKRGGHHVEPWSISRLCFDASALISLLVSIAITSCYIVSQRYGGLYFEQDAHESMCRLVSFDSHRVYLSWINAHQPIETAPAMHWVLRSPWTDWDPHQFNWLGIRYTSDREPPATGLRLSLPTLYVLILTLLLPLGWLLRQLRFHTRRRRAARGQCLTCGYDLRHSPDRCPECGAPSPLSRPASTSPPTSPAKTPLAAGAHHS